jgi:hypothetical protein
LGIIFRALVYRKPAISIGLVVAFIALDLVLLPNCTPITAPDHGPEILGPQEGEHRFTLHLQLESHYAKEGGALYWTYGYRHGVSENLELGVKLISSLIPNGIQLEGATPLRVEKIYPLALHLSAGWHLLDFIPFSMNSGGDSFNIWGVTPTLLFGTNQLYGGLTLPLILPKSQDLEIYYGGLLGTNFPAGEALYLRHQENQKFILSKSL